VLSLFAGSRVKETHFGERSSSMERLEFKKVLGIVNERWKVAFSELRLAQSHCERVKERWLK